MKLDNAKTFRLLNLYERLNRGETVNKKDFANAFGISEKSVQRDIDDLRIYLAECYENGDDITVVTRHSQSPPPLQGWLRSVPGQSPTAWKHHTFAPGHEVSCCVPCSYGR